MKRKYCLIMILAFALPGGVAAQAGLHLGVSPGQPPGPSVLEIAMISHQSDVETLKGWIALEAPFLIEASADDAATTENFSLTAVGVPSVYVYGEQFSINRVFRVDPALPENSSWKVKVELGDKVLESTVKTVRRLGKPLMHAAVVAMRLRDDILLEEIGTILIGRDPDQTHGYRYRGFARAMQGRYVEAEEDILKARTIFFENNPPADADGRMIPNWEPPEILDRALRRIHMAQQAQPLAAD